MPTENLPRSWPAGILYLPVSIPDPCLDRSQTKQVFQCLEDLAQKLASQKLRQSPTARSTSTCPLVRITKIIDSKHPACGEHGLYATKKLSPGQFVIEYVGYLSTEPYCSQTSDYILRLSVDVAIDAERAGNEARFINDYRGVSNKPNVVFDTFMDAKGQVKMGIFVGHGVVGKDVGEAAAEAVLAVYPNPKSLWRAYQGALQRAAANGCDGQMAAENLLAPWSTRL